MSEPVLNQQAQTPAVAGTATLELRDIHLPEPVSWWPIAPGWWILLASVLLLTAVIYIARKAYKNRQLKREIKAELEQIKARYRQTQNKPRLAEALSVLLRRTSISFYPKSDIAGLIGHDWLAYLDETHSRSSNSKKFQSSIGEVMLTAPYLPDDAVLDFDAEKLIRLCESWLLAPHQKLLRRKSTHDANPTDTFAHVPAPADMHSATGPSKVTP